MGCRPIDITKFHFIHNRYRNELSKNKTTKTLNRTPNQMSIPP